MLTQVHVSDVDSLPPSPWSPPVVRFSKKAHTASAPSVDASRFQTFTVRSAAPLTSHRWRLLVTSITERTRPVWFRSTWVQNEGRRKVGSGQFLHLFGSMHARTRSCGKAVQPVAAVGLPLTWMQLDVLRFQTRSVESPELETMTQFVTDATPVTVFVCPASVTRHAPGSLFQTLTMQSSLPEMRRSSLKQARAQT